MNNFAQPAARHQLPLRVGVCLGTLAAGLTLSVQQLSTISDIRIVGLLQMSAMFLIMPGLFLSMILAGNVHAFSLAAAAPANAIFYSAIGWLLTKILNTRRNSPSSEN